MKFKKLFISISTIAPLSAALSFVSCNPGSEGENIFTEVNTDQKLNIAKTTIETGINEFYQNAKQTSGFDTTKLSAIKDDIDSLATPLANFLLIIDSQNKKFLDFFYENNKSGLIPDLSLEKKKKYSKKTVQGSNRLVSFFNKIINTRKSMKKKTEYEDKGISGLGGLGSGKSDLWSDLFEDVFPLENEKSFFEKIGDSVLTSQKAKDFWIKFINNKFRKKF